MTSNDELFDQFEHRVPVVLGPDGAVLGEGEIAFTALLRTVLRARLRWVTDR